MGEVRDPFLRPKAGEAGSDAAPRRLAAAFGRVAEQGFALGKARLKRIESGRGRGEETQRGPHPLDGGAHGRALRNGLEFSSPFQRSLGSNSAFVHRDGTGLGKVESGAGAEKTKSQRETQPNGER